MLLLVDQALVWNTHQRITEETALAHVEELCSLTPPVSTPSPLIAEKPTSQDAGQPSDLDTPDELAIRALILGILYRTLKDFKTSRTYLTEAHGLHDAVLENKWVGGVALFELAVLELKELEAREQAQPRPDNKSDSSSVASIGLKPTLVEWNRALKEAASKLEKAMAISGNSVDLSSRLDTRVNMLKDEIAIKREMLGL